MSKKHIVLTGVESNNCITFNMLLEGFNYRTTMIEPGGPEYSSISELKKSVDQPDLIIFGSKCSKDIIKRFFDSIESPDQCPPFIILDDIDKTNLMDWLLKCGFYGYMISPTEPYKLIRQIDSIFLNIKRLKI